MRYYVHQCSDKTDNFEFLGPNLPRISNSKTPCVPIFSQNGQLLIFRPKLGKLHNYMQCFGSNIAEGVAESWMEAEMGWMEVEMSWVEVGEWFSNTPSKHRRLTFIFRALA